MISIDIRGMDEVQRALRGLASDQIPYALSRAINGTAFQVMKAERAKITSTFDRPTPFVQRGIRYEKATKQTLTARIYAAPESDKALSPNAFGGGRETKIYEAVMRSAGVLQPGKHAVPGSGAKLDRYGNIDRDQLAAILKSLGLLSAQNASRGGKKRQRAMAKSGTYFVGGRGHARHLHAGIWQRVGSRGLKPVIMFISPATYSARFEFVETARAEVVRVFAANFDAAITMAMKTAR